MSLKTPTTYAFIDGENLYKGISRDVVRKGKVVYRAQSLDYRRFRHYLFQRYGVSKAFIFIGYQSKQKPLYESLEKNGFELIFKKTTVMKFESRGKITEKVKGNVDIDIAVYAVGRLFGEYDKAVFVSGDGDFLELYDYMVEKGKFLKLLIPNSFAYSRLLRENYRSKIQFINTSLTRFMTQKSPANKIGQVLRSDKSLGVSGHRDVKSVSNRAKKVNSKIQKGVSK
ncbi:MAG: NYN domain-containing protein [Candidatus Nomurabacteria bacterium]|jgi:uncharacterized LabA/DUF88 family protein|nr:NYN domain-containing protein [Candidatus Nomurabacteria bacterium]